MARFIVYLKLIDKTVGKGGYICQLPLLGALAGLSRAQPTEPSTMLIGLCVCECTNNILSSSSIETHLAEVLMEAASLATAGKRVTGRLLLVAVNRAAQHRRQRVVIRS